MFISQPFAGNAIVTPAPPIPTYLGYCMVGVTRAAISVTVGRL